MAYVGYSAGRNGIIIEVVIVNERRVVPIYRL